MSDSLGEELLAAIRAAPDDRALRLVYADWLMERGDPRGEWIALSCGQETENTEREMRRRALWQHYGRRWTAEDCESSGLNQITYRHGFPEAAVLQNGERAESLRARHPLRELTIQLRPGLLGALAASRVLETVRSVRLIGDIEQTNEDELLAFLDAPALARLEELESYGTRGLWGALARMRRTAELTRLDIGSLDATQARWLARACPALRALHCSEASAVALRTISDTATFRLRELFLRFPLSYVLDQQTAAALDDLLASPVIGELTNLTLVGAAFRAPTIGALARLPSAAMLRKLTISTYRHATILDDIQASRFPALESLHLENTADAADVAARFPTLVELMLDRTEITRTGVERLMSSLTRLEQLWLVGTPLADNAVQAIARSVQARSLRQLWLIGAGLGRGAIASIVGSSHLTELRDLSLRDNRLDDDSVRSLADGPFDRMANLSLTMHDPRLEPLFAEAWLPTASFGDNYERKLELSGRAVARKVR